MADKRNFLHIAYARSHMFQPRITHSGAILAINGPFASAEMGRSKQPWGLGAARVPAVVCLAAVGCLPAFLRSPHVEALPAQELVERMVAECSRLAHRRDGVEMFAGVGHIAFAGCPSGMNTAVFDIETHAECDILTLMGLWIITNAICSLPPHAWLWIGLPRGSWIFLSRSSAGRRCYFVEGVSTAFVLSQNQIAERLATLIQARRRKNKKQICGKNW